MSVVFCATSVVFMAKPCIAKNRVRTYKKGFTYEKLDEETVARIKGKSYKKGAEISLDSLRYLRIRYVDFEGNTQDGEMIVNKKIARKTLKVFYELYKIKYPIAKMQLVDEYDADDEKSMADNNTSAFNYRKVANSNKLSNHSRGLAIDINPRINPYITSYGIAPANSKVYKVREVSKCRGKYRDYMIHRGDPVYKIFKKYGFSWGGDWKHSKDYQHFEA
ncbi:MAG: M15 family metallopeptidase [Roseburia sp.]|nr:M15 family metallopeptidase [Roseburia sp.]